MVRLSETRKAYTYTNAGDRGTTTYTTDNGTTTWQYDNYDSFGLNKGVPSRAPQTMRLLQSGNPTAEEFHYLYDGAGALQCATFALSQTGYTPTGSNPWYDENHLATSRARVVYDNFSGLNFNLYYYWDTLTSGSYNSTDITGFQYGYDGNTLLKTGATFLDGNGSSWLTDHNEAYVYDSVFDYLTSADYNVGGSGDTPEAWSYDAAGNRATDSAYTSNDWEYDNLNRMSKAHGVGYTNDVLGNRLSTSGTSNGWDQLNRMTSFTSSGSVTTNYTYRSDGLRVLKASPTASTSFAYDGQMGFEDVDAGSTAAVTDYAIGGRGLDRLAKTSSGTTTVAYPLFDGHGNMVSTLAKNGSGYTPGNQRSFDAWGNILGGNGTGDPKGRYCGSLGHKQDDESGFIYMRARYCDPNTGRFISPDADMNGSNWFVYAQNQPTSMADPTGRDAQEIIDLLQQMMRDDRLPDGFYKAFLDRRTGIRDTVHRLISKQGFTDEEKMDLIEDVADEWQSGIELETPEELASDIEAGEPSGDLVLEEQTAIAEQETGLIDIE